MGESLSCLRFRMKWNVWHVYIFFVILYKSLVCFVLVCLKRRMVSNVTGVVLGFQDQKSFTTAIQSFCVARLVSLRIKNMAVIRFTTTNKQSLLFITWSCSWIASKHHSAWLCWRPFWQLSLPAFWSMEQKPTVSPSSSSFLCWPYA